VFVSLVQPGAAVTRWPVILPVHGRWFRAFFRHGGMFLRHETSVIEMRPCRHGHIRARLFQPTPLRKRRAGGSSARAHDRQSREPADLERGETFGIPSSPATRIDLTGPHSLPRRFTVARDNVSNLRSPFAALLQRFLRSEEPRHSGRSSRQRTTRTRIVTTRCRWNCFVAGPLLIMRILVSRGRQCLIHVCKTRR
jgi:hypothetical protein